jgi:hypothetical protein
MPNKKYPKTLAPARLVYTRSLLRQEMRTGETIADLIISLNAARQTRHRAARVLAGHPLGPQKLAVAAYKMKVVRKWISGCNAPNSLQLISLVADFDQRDGRAPRRLDVIGHVNGERFQFPGRYFNRRHQR